MTVRRTVAIVVVLVAVALTSFGLGRIGPVYAQGAAGQGVTTGPGMWASPGVAGWCPMGWGGGGGMMGWGGGMMGWGGPGRMGWGGPGRMGPGMMGWGWGGQGRMGWGWGAQQSNLNLSASDVKSYLEQWIAIAGNPSVKVGNVTETDANTITAEIVTTDKAALVQRFSVDRHTGYYTPVR